MDCLFCDNSSTTAYAQLGARHYFRCPQCHLVFLDPQQRLDSAGEKAQYDLHENDPDDPNYRAFLRRLSNPLIEKLESGSYGLDYGCGPGPALAAMLSERGFVMDLYDPLYFNDESLLENRYDFITCTEVAEHFHAPRDEFARLDSLLRPSGWLAIMTSWLTDEIDFSRWHYPRDPTHVCFYAQQTFVYWAQRRNWHIEIPDTNVVLLQKPQA